MDQQLQRRGHLPPATALPQRQQLVRGKRRRRWRRLHSLDLQRRCRRDGGRRASVDRLLAVSGNSATYSVRLVDVSAGGEAISLIDPTTLAGADDWRGADAGSIDPDRLVIGDDYRLLIATTYVTGTSALVSGSADYDNVVLRVAAGQAGAADGGGGGNGRGGSNESSRSLLALLRGVTPATATLAGKRLLVAVKCPRKLDHACRITTKGLLRKGKPATSRRSVEVRRGSAS